jgi:hypothetical protein
MIAGFLGQRSARTQHQELGSFKSTAVSSYPAVHGDNLMLFYNGAADEYGVLYWETSGVNQWALMRWTPTQGKRALMSSVERHPTYIRSVWSHTSCLLQRNTGALLQDKGTATHVDLVHGSVTLIPDPSTEDRYRAHEQPVLISDTAVIDCVSNSGTGYKACLRRWCRAEPDRLEWLDFILPGESTGAYADMRALSDHSVLFSAFRVPMQYIVRFDSDGRNPRLLRTLTFGVRFTVFYRPNDREIVCAKTPVDEDGVAAAQGLEVFSLEGSHGEIGGIVKDALHDVVLLQDRPAGRGRQEHTYRIVRVKDPHHVRAGAGAGAGAGSGAAAHGGGRRRQTSVRKSIHAHRSRTRSRRSSHRSRSRSRPRPRRSTRRSTHGSRSRSRRPRSRRMRR